MKEVTYEDWIQNPTPRNMWVWDAAEDDNWHKDSLCKGCIRQKEKCDYYNAEHINCSDWRCK